MEPLDVMTLPARLSGREQLAYGAATVAVAVALWQAAIITRAALSRGGLAGVLLALCVVAVLAATYVFAGAAVQVFLVYNLRDRGRHVVAFRVETGGIRWLLGGCDVLMPWAGLAPEITDRQDVRYRLLLVSRGPWPHRWDPLSLGFVRRLRKDGRYSVSLTNTDPTDVELAAAIERLSGGRVRLGLSPS